MIFFSGYRKTQYLFAYVQFSNKCILSDGPLHRALSQSRGGDRRQLVGGGREGDTLIWPREASRIPARASQRPAYLHTVTGTSRPVPAADLTDDLACPVPVTDQTNWHWVVV